MRLRTGHNSNKIMEDVVMSFLITGNTHTYWVDRVKERVWSLKGEYFERWNRNRTGLCRNTTSEPCDCPCANVVLSTDLTVRGWGWGGEGEGKIEGGGEYEEKNRKYVTIERKWLHCLNCLNIWCFHSALTAIQSRAVSSTLILIFHAPGYIIYICMLWV